MYKEVKLGDFSISYQVFGAGNEGVLCLHGHSRSSSDFKFLESDSLKVVSIDLFLHHESKFPLHRIERNPVRWEELIPIFQLLIQTEFPAQFNVLAYSQGGRFALKLVETWPEKLSSFTLLAPDGLNNKSFYNVSSRVFVLRKLFRFWQKKPAHLKGIAGALSKAKLVRPKVKEFIDNFTSDKFIMERAANSWMGFRMIQPQPKKIGEIVRKNPIEWKIIMGKYDQVIRPLQAEIFQKRAGISVEISLVESGHDFFKPNAIERFKPLLPFVKKDNFRH